MDGWMGGYEIGEMGKGVWIWGVCLLEMGFEVGIYLRASSRIHYFIPYL